MYRFLAFILVPLADLALLIWTGTQIGIVWTLVIIFGTGILGAYLVKRQGLAVWTAARSRLESGQLPAQELAHGAMLVAAGAFLMSPGLITDLAGFVLLIPAAREWIRRLAVRHYTKKSDRTVRVEVWR